MLFPKGNSNLAKNFVPSEALYQSDNKNSMIGFFHNHYKLNFYIVITQKCNFQIKNCELCCFLHTFLSFSTTFPTTYIKK